MPPVVRPLVAIERALVILRARQRHDMFAVAQRKEACLLALHEFFDDDFTPAFAEAALEHEVDGFVGIGFRLRR